LSQFCVADNFGRFDNFWKKVVFCRYPGRDHGDAGSDDRNGDHASPSALIAAIT